jgi:hypothetical protein
MQRRCKLRSAAFDYLQSHRVRTRRAAFLINVAAFVASVSEVYR